MNILYISPNYKPEIITNRYLHIDLQSGKAIVSETVKKKHTNYTYREYELPESDYPRYSKAIQAALDLVHYFPNAVDLKED